MRSETSDATNYYSPDDEKQIDGMVAHAVEAAAKGMSVEQLLEVMLASLPPQAKEKLKKKFSAALAKRGLKEPAKDADIPSRGTLARLRDAFALSTRQMMDRITALVRARPDVAASIAQAGKILMKNGVIIDRVQVSEADLGTMAPLAGIGQGQDRSGGRSA